MSLSLRYAARSHVGLIRDGNEDSGYAGPRLLVLADGMGGAAAGEVASTVVVQTMSELDEAVQRQLPSNPAQALADRIHTAHERLRAIITQNPQLEGMGTTLDAFLFGDGHVAYAHIGDSRAYRLRGGRLEQLTSDHTWVQRLVDEGRISEEEAGHHPQRSLLMRALDGRGEVAEADMSVTDVQAGDRFLLCSDGLSSFVSFDTLESALSGYTDVHQAADALIQLALRAGGPDNVTCIVADAVTSGPSGHADSGGDPTQYIELPITVGAAAEHHGPGLPSFNATTQSQNAGGTPTPNAAGATDPIPSDTPAGRAARLRRGDKDKDKQPSEKPEKKEGGKGGKRWVKPTIGVVVALAVIGAGCGGAYYWSQQQYYVANDDGVVAIYQGVDLSLGGFELSKVYSTSPQVILTTLPTSSQNRVRSSIAAASLPDAQAIVHTLSVQSLGCTAVLTAPVATTPTLSTGLGQSASPSATGSVSSTAKAPKGSTSPKASTTPSPSVTPTPAQTVPDQAVEACAGATAGTG
jgi:serine/threonine protein phosphatase PrpC